MQSCPVAPILLKLQTLASAILGRSEEDGASTSQPQLREPVKTTVSLGQRSCRQSRVPLVLVARVLVSVPLPRCEGKTRSKHQQKALRSGDSGDRLCTRGTADVCLTGGWKGGGKGAAWGTGRKCWRVGGQACGRQAPRGGRPPGKAGWLGGWDFKTHSLPSTVGEEWIRADCQGEAEQST